MAVKLGDAFVRIFADDKDLDRGLESARQKTTSAASVMQGVFQGVGQAIFNTVKQGVSAAIGEIEQAVQKSSNLSESVNKVGVIFGNSAKEIMAFAETADTALGQSKQQALDAISTFATFGKAAGLSGEGLVKFSTGFDTLASDFASFFNTSPEQAITAIGAALRGESEPIRQYGVLLDDATLRQKALELGIVSTTANALTPQQRVLAAQKAIYEQTSTAQGDFARTSEGLANAQRILAAEFENGSASLGNSFRPAVEAITNMLIGLAPEMFSYAQNITDQFANGLASGIRAIIPVIQTIRQLFTYWFKPGSPPRILPDLTKWGRGALRAYLDGFQASDVKEALGTLGKSVESLLRGFVKTGSINEGDLLSRVVGSRDAITRAVSEFKQFGSVSSRTMADIIRQAGPAGASVSGLVRAYFDLEKASGNVTKAQDELNAVSQKYQDIINPISAELSANQAAQQAIRDKERVQELRNQIADLGLVEEASKAAREELTALQAKQAAGGNGNFLEDVKDRQRILDLQQEIAQGANAASDAQLAQLQIDEIAIRTKLDGAEDEKAAAEAAEQAKLDAAKAAEEAAKAELDNAQAVIDLQVEKNNLIVEQMDLEAKLQKQREDALQKAQDEAEKAKNDATKLSDAKFDYQFNSADTAGQLDLVKNKLAGLQPETVEYYQTLTQLSKLQEQYNKELANPALDDAAKAAKEAADAQFDYKYSIADTSGQLELLRGKLAKTTEGSADYYHLLQQISQLDKQRIGEIDAVTDAQFAYQQVLADTPGKIELLKNKLAETTEGSAEYYQIASQIASLEQSYQAQLDSDARQQAAHDEAEFNKALRESEQALKKAQTEAEQLHQAQLNYNLSLADTPGKIALMQKELANSIPGSVEYFNILTQIHQLQVQYDKELENAAKKAAALGATDLSAGLDAGVIGPLGESSEAGNNLAAALKEAFAPIGPASEKTQILAEKIEVLVNKIGLLFGIDFASWGEKTKNATDLATDGFALYGQSAVDASSSVGTSTDDVVDKMTRTVDIISALVNGDWATLWQLYKKNAIEAYGDTDTEAEHKLNRLEEIISNFGDHSATLWQRIQNVNSLLTLGIFNDNAKWWSDLLGQATSGLGNILTSTSNWLIDIQERWARYYTDHTREFQQWMGDTTRSVGDWFGSLGDKFSEGASNLSDYFLEGIKSSWYKVENWFSDKLQALRDQLPFSEPKDPSSPLRGLKKSGQALVEMVQTGISAASLDVKPLANSLLTTPAGLSPAPNSSGDTILHLELGGIVIQGNATIEDVRKGVNQAGNDLLNGLRQRGLAR